ncbi:MAG TPA: hypothetical protein VK796_02240 [Cytophaga sp.]|jgi:hypothetical protein|nr:hypothetical protein [Cytophaga sp.]
MTTEQKVIHEKLRLEQNLIAGLLAGLAAGLIGAVLWGVITVVTEYQIGYMAVAVGAGVGFSIRYFGKGLDQIFGVCGAVIAIVSCALGNYFSLIGFIANMGAIGYIDAFFVFSPEVIVEMMKENFNPMDVLFYALAAYEGYRFSFRVVEETPVDLNAAK